MGEGVLRPLVGDQWVHADGPYSAYRRHGRSSRQPRHRRRLPQIWPTRTRVAIRRWSRTANATHTAGSWAVSRAGTHTRASWRVVRRRHGRIEDTRWHLR